MPFDGHQFKQFREGQLGVTQLQMAFKLETDTRTISSWENGHTQPSFKMLDKLTNSFENVSIPSNCFYQPPLGP